MGFQDKQGFYNKIFFVKIFFFPPRFRGQDGLTGTATTAAPPVAGGAGGGIEGGVCPNLKSSKFLRIFYNNSLIVCRQIWDFGGIWVPGKYSFKPWLRVIKKISKNFPSKKNNSVYLWVVQLLFLVGQLVCWYQTKVKKNFEIS
jgi:hypothetical protein